MYGEVDAGRDAERCGLLRLPRLPLLSTRLPTAEALPSLGLARSSRRRCHLGSVWVAKASAEAVCPSCFESLGWMLDATGCAVGCCEILLGAVVVLLCVLTAAMSRHRRTGFEQKEAAGVTRCEQNGAASETVTGLEQNEDSSRWTCACCDYSGHTPPCWLSGSRAGKRLS